MNLSVTSITMEPQKKMFLTVAEGYRIEIDQNTRLCDIRVPREYVNVLRDPREDLTQTMPPPEYGIMIELWMNSLEDDIMVDSGQALHDFVKGSSHPAAKATLEYFEKAMKQ